MYECVQYALTFLRFCRFWEGGVCEGGGGAFCLVHKCADGDKTVSGVGATSWLVVNSFYFWFCLLCFVFGGGGGGVGGRARNVGL